MLTRQQKNDFRRRIGIVRLEVERLHATLSAISPRLKEWNKRRVAEGFKDPEFYAAYASFKRILRVSAVQSSRAEQKFKAGDADESYRLIGLLEDSLVAVYEGFYNFLQIAKDRGFDPSDELGNDSPL